MALNDGSAAKQRCWIDAHTCWPSSARRPGDSSNIGSKVSLSKLLQSQILLRLQLFVHMRDEQINNGALFRYVTVWSATPVQLLSAQICAESRAGDQSQLQLLLTCPWCVQFEDTQSAAKWQAEHMGRSRHHGSSSQTLMKLHQEQRAAMDEDLRVSMPLMLHHFAPSHAGDHAVLLSASYTEPQHQLHVCHLLTCTVMHG